MAQRHKHQSHEPTDCTLRITIELYRTSKLCTGNEFTVYNSKPQEVRKKTLTFRIHHQNIADYILLLNMPAHQRPKSRSVPYSQMLSRLLPRRHHRRLLQTLLRSAPDVDLHQRLCSSSAASSPSLSIWRRKKEMGKEGLMAVAQLKRLAALPPAGGHPRLEQFMRSHVSRLLRTDLLAVLAELLRQDHVILSMKVLHSYPNKTCVLYCSVHDYILVTDSCSAEESIYLKGTVCKVVCCVVLNLELQNGDPNRSNLKNQ